MLYDRLPVPWKQYLNGKTKLKQEKQEMQSKVSDLSCSDSPKSSTRVGSFKNTLFLEDPARVHTFLKSPSKLEAAQTR